MITTLAAAALLAAVPSIAAMKWGRRVLIVAAPSASDHRIVEQRRTLAAWRAGADLRDLSVVEVIGDRVTGAADTALALRRIYGLRADGFTVVLVGKDGGEKLRSRRPLAATALAQTIDSMPMRRAEGR